MTVEAVRALVGKEFPDTEHFRREGVFLRAKSRDNMGTVSAAGDLQTDQGE